jgi:hypothetical protein
MSSRPSTPEKYVELVKQAIFELEDIIEAKSFDIDEIDNSTAFEEILLKELRNMRAQMADGSYQFGKQDLPMMRIVKQHTETELPCIRLLYQINETHREGLDVEEF